MEIPSSSGAKLAEALAKAQAEFEAAEKDKVNPHFGSRFASLGSITRATRPALAKHGLAVTQHPKRGQDGGVECESVLRHASGETLSATVEVPLGQRTAQAYGSALTYARRYSYAALLQIEIDEDDDGNEAQRAAPAVAHAAPPPKSNGHAAPPKPIEPPKRKPSQEMADERPAPPPQPEVAYEHPRERPPPVTFRFGKRKGATSHEVGDEQLVWYRDCARQACADPEKARFLEANKAELAALEAEIRWRSTGRT